MEVLDNLVRLKRECEKTQLELSVLRKSAEGYTNLLSQYIRCLYAMGEALFGILSTGEFTLDSLSIRLHWRKELLRRIVDMYRRVGEGNVDVWVDAALSYSGMVRSLEDAIVAYDKATGSRVQFGRFRRKFDDLVGTLREYAMKSGQWDNYTFLIIEMIAKLCEDIPDELIGANDFYRRILVCSACGKEPPSDGWETFTRTLAGRKVTVAFCPECFRARQQPRLNYILSSLLDYVAFMEQYVLSLRSQVALLRAADDFLNAKEENLEE